MDKNLTDILTPDADERDHRRRRPRRSAARSATS